MQFLQNHLIGSITSLLREYVEVTATPDAYSFDMLIFDDISSFGVVVHFSQIVFSVSDSLDLKDVSFSPAKLSEFLDGYPAVVESCKVGRFKLELVSQRIQVTVDDVKCTCVRPTKKICFFLLFIFYLSFFYLSCCFVIVLLLRGRFVSFNCVFTS
jgi:hypothetical protein